MTIQYITLQRVKEVLPSSYSGSDDQQLGDILTSSCAFLDNYCGRANGGFAIQNYDELYHGTGENTLFLSQTPIQSISRISTVTVPAVSITNSDPDMGTRALVQIVGTPGNPINLNSQYTSTGLTLTYIKNAVTTTNTLTWASYPTITTLVAAINAVGNNWKAVSQGGFGTWSTTDLRATQGAFGSRITTSYLWLHWMDVPQYRVNEVSGEITSWFGFPRGSFNFRVGYSAGYATTSNGVVVSGFPDDLAQALAELTTATYYAKAVNPNLLNQKIQDYGYTAAARKGFEGLSVLARKTILSYKKYSTSHFSSW